MTANASTRSYMEIHRPPQQLVCSLRVVRARADTLRPMDVACRQLLTLMGLVLRANQIRYWSCNIFANRALLFYLAYSLLLVVENMRRSTIDIIRCSTIAGISTSGDQPVPIWRCAQVSKPIIT